MGSQDTHSTQSQSSTSAPGEMTTPTVQGIIGQLNPMIASSGLTPAETDAIAKLKANGQAGSPYAAAQGANASELLAGGGATSQNGALTDNLNTLKDTLSRYTDPEYSTVGSPEVARAMQAAHAGVATNVNGMFAGSGRTGSGANAQNLAQGFESVDAPLILGQVNTDATNRINAANTLYGAGNTTSGAITGNNHTALSNKVAGNTSATAALDADNWGAKSILAAEELGKSIPAADLGMLAQIGIPIAGLNTTTNSNGTSDTSVSPSALQIATGIGGMMGSGASTAANGATSGGSGVLGLLGML